MCRNREVEGWTLNGTMDAGYMEGEYVWAHAVSYRAGGR